MKNAKAIMDSPIPGMDTLDERARELEQFLKNDEAAFERRILADVDSLIFAEDEAAKNISDAGEWLVAHTSYIKRLCKRYSWIGEVDDLYQEACLAIINAFGTYDTHQRDVKDTTYYWKCAKNAIIKVYRTSKAQRRTGSLLANEEFFSGPEKKGVDEDGIIAAVCGSAEDSLMEAEACNFWIQAINRLPKKQCDTMLWTIKGLTQVEVAEKMGISQASVSLYLKTARATLSALRKAVSNTKKEVVSEADAIKADGLVRMWGSADDYLVNIDSYDFWMDAVDKLPKKQRTVMLLTIEGKTIPEAAEKMGVGLWEASSCLNKARAALKNLRKAVA